MTTWQKYRKAIMGTLAGMGVWIAAIMAFQLAVMPLDIPLQQSSVKSWTLAKDYTTAVTVSGVTYTVSIRAGFVTDGASIPDKLAPPLGLVRNAPSIIRGALVHDALYESQLLDRETADSILYAACLQDGTDPDKAQAIWLAVHEWGFIVWDRHTPESIKQARELVSVSEKREL